jgi:hypothetical protein
MHHVGNMILIGLTFFLLQFCIMRKLVQCGQYFRSRAVPPYTSFTVFCVHGCRNYTVVYVTDVFTKRMTNINEVTDEVPNKQVAMIQRIRFIQIMGFLFRTILHQIVIAFQHIFYDKY